MLEPDSRAALTEQLRPPSGFQLSHAVATTFTLDLTAALSIPLAFAAHRVRESRDPIAILDAVRRAADKIDLFAQAGQVAEPRKTSDLFALLEPMIHPVQAPRRNLLFHPKVWVLEYANGDSRSYRMLCASRNLTDDRSWDLVVRLDGLVGDRPTEQSAPLAAFVRALPAMGVQPLTSDRVARIVALADAVAAVEWERPADVRSLRFHPFGVPRIPTRPVHELFSGVRHGIISPFVSDDGIVRILPPQSNATTVLARREQLDRLSAATLSRIEGLVLDEAANDDASDEVGHSESTSDGTHRLTPAESLAGLHAKAFVVDRQSGSHLYVGSANATAPAFGGNVELLVEFEGPRTKLGVAALLGEQSPLRGLTIPYQPAGGADTPAEELANQALEQVLRELASRRYFARVTSEESVGVNAFRDGHEAIPQYRILLTADGSADIPDGMNARVSLLTRTANTAAVPGAPAEFDGLALTDITPFVVIRITDQRDVTASTVVAAILDGDVPGRQDAVIARQLADRSAFMRLLALLLALEGGDGSLHFDDLASAVEGWADDGSGLFETLVRAIGVGHSGLADVRRIVEHVRAAEERRSDGEQSVLPDGFDELWAAVWEAYSEKSEATR
ncbi:phospholipase D family protein [Mycobacterium sp. LTG2003]